MIFSPVVSEKIKLPHLINLVSLILVACGCWIMGKQEIKQNYYFDSAVGGYLMISVGTAFISTTTFKEILVGT